VTFLLAALNMYVTIVQKTSDLATRGFATGSAVTSLVIVARETSSQTSQARSSYLWASSFRPSQVPVT